MVGLSAFSPALLLLRAMQSLAMQSTSFLVAGGVGIVANYALFSQYTPVSMDLMLKEVASVVQPLAKLKVVLPALFGFMGGSLLLLVWKYLSSRAVRLLLDYNGWFLHPKKPINKVSGASVPAS